MLRGGTCDGAAQGTGAAGGGLWHGRLEFGEYHLDGGETRAQGGGKRASIMAQALAIL